MGGYIRSRAKQKYRSALEKSGVCPAPLRLRVCPLEGETEYDYRD